MSDLYSGINTSKCASSLFLDLKKAFDTVDHTVLLNKLYSCGIRGTTHNWFESYLSNRYQLVKVCSGYSEVGTIVLRVPQRSVLGAVLYINFRNDLCNGRFEGNLTSFADDTAF